MLVLFPGRYGHYRAAILEMRGKKTRRPISKLYAMEATRQSEEAGTDGEWANEKAVRFSDGENVRVRIYIMWVYPGRKDVGERPT